MKNIHYQTFTAKLNVLTKNNHSHNHEVYNKKLEEINVRLNKKPKDSTLLLEKASCLRHLNKLEEVFQIHQMLLSQYPDNLDYVFMMGLLLIEFNKYEESIKYFDQVLEHTPSHRDANFNKGLVLQRYVNGR